MNVGKIAQHIMEKTGKKGLHDISSKNSFMQPF